MGFLDDFAPAIVATVKPQMICPHCHTQGSVSTRADRLKAGISGGKATGAVLTGGASLFWTGLSRTQKVTKAQCGVCGMVWHVQ